MSSSPTSHFSRYSIIRSLHFPVLHSILSILSFPIPSSSHSALAVCLRLCCCLEQSQGFHFPTPFHISARCPSTSAALPPLITYFHLLDELCRVSLAVLDVLVVAVTVTPPPPKVLRAHILPLTNCAFNKSGDRFITGSYDRTCKVTRGPAALRRNPLVYPLPFVLEAFLLRSCLCSPAVCTATGLGYLPRRGGPHAGGPQECGKCLWLLSPLPVAGSIILL